MINGLLLAATTIIWLATIADVWRTSPADVLRIPRVGWLFTVVVMPLVGTLGWWLLGRPRKSSTPPKPGLDKGWPIGPEDDPQWVVDTTPSRPTKASERNRR